MRLPLMAVTVLALCCSLTTAAPTPPAHLPPYRNPTLPVEVRVEDLLGRMTLEEKLNQIRSDQNPDIWQKAATTTGFGEVYDILRPLDARAAAELANRVQRMARRSRLRIPLIIRDEALHGLAGKGSTSFPQSIALAATWDPALVQRVGDAIGHEARIRGVERVLAPVINIARDCRWGRTEETYGEDPYLQSRITVGYVRGVEGRGVATCPKHFVANVGDGGRDSHAIYLTEQALREIYLPPFEAAFREAGARSVMTAYNSLNGRACSANRWLLRDLLKGEWGFLGVVGSDYGAAEGTGNRHRNAADDVLTAAENINAGLDIDWPNLGVWGKPLATAVARGLVSQAVLDDAVRRMLRNKFTLGLFDQPYTDPEEAARVVQCEEHRAISLQAAREGMVLLKNRNKTLPLSPTIRSLALIGAAAQGGMPLGGYSGSPGRTVGVLEGLRTRLGSNVEIKTARGGVARLAGGTALIPASCYTDLRAEYFNSRDLSGAPVTVRAESRIDFASDYAAPLQGLGATDYSIRWTGKLTPPDTGLCTFALNSDDGVRLFVDGDLLIDNWTIHAPTTDRAQLHVKRGQPLELRLEYYQAAGLAQAHLSWGIAGETDPAVAEAAQVAHGCDAAIVVATIEEGEGRDRSSLDLPGHQVETIQAVAATGVPTVVVLIAGAPVTMTGWLDSVDAILDAWYPGQEGGTALAEVLFGDRCPGGKLPITFPRTVGQCPIYYNLPPSGRGYDYVDLSGSPQYPFGHGLSYTTFAYSNLVITPTKPRQGQTVTVTCDITNTGDRPGDEVPQLYLRDTVASMVRPLKELKDFCRVTLAPGQTTTVTFLLPPDKLAFWNAQMKHVVEPGDFEVMVGSSSSDIRLRGAFTVQ
jgi:beta-glucosidase